MEQHGCKKVEFAGFMVDSVQANFNAVREIFCFGDKTILVAGKERTCQFQWLLIGTQGNTLNLSFRPCTSDYATSTGSVNQKLPPIP